jgi:hypothetical protein
MGQDARGQRRILLGSAAVMAAALTVGGFFLGARMRAAASPQPTPSAVVAAVAAASATAPTPSSSPTATRRLGAADHWVRAWDGLTGGECLGTFRDPWRARYDVVACRTAHASQLLRTVTLPKGGYPSRAALKARLGGTCQAAVSLSAASRYHDVRVSVSYPTAARWRTGDRTAYCFVSRAGGGALTGSLAAKRG